MPIAQPKKEPLERTRFRRNSSAGTRMRSSSSSEKAERRSPGVFCCKTNTFATGLQAPTLFCWNMFLACNIFLVSIPTSMPMAARQKTCEPGPIYFNLCVLFIFRCHW